MLIYVLESKGSSPGRQGFLMAVNRDGEMEGSIGGGIMEFKFVELAKDKLLAGGEVSELRKQVHDKQSARNQSGMICSGEQTNFLYRPGERDLGTIDVIIDHLVNNKPAMLQIDASGVSVHSVESSPAAFSFENLSNGKWVYRQKIGCQNALHIVGGGHCALALSRVMSMMNFYIQLYDTRGNLNTIDRNTYVHQKHQLESYSDVAKFIAEGQNQFVVIMTVGYRTDMEVVRSLLEKEFRYVGLLGSRKKIQKVLSDLKKEGFSPERLRIIHAPVGLQINSQTPEEIAISIAAEIIQVKNSQPVEILTRELKKSFTD